MRTDRLFLAGALLCFSLFSFAQPGSLDGDFSADGKVTTDISDNDRVVGLALQQDGKIIALRGIGSSNAATLVRYFPDGSLDNTFGTDGIVYLLLDSEQEGHAVAIQQDGKIVITGTYPSVIMVARFNTDGSRDPSFGSNGAVITDISEYGDIGYDIAVQPDGKILVAGETGSGAIIDFVLVRYSTDGSLDNSFSFDGSVITDFDGGYDRARAMVVQLDGKILVTGYSSQESDGGDSDFATARYNSDGTLDLTFGTNGKVTTNVVDPGINPASKDQAHSMVLQPDGKIVIAGSSEWGGGFPEWFYSVVRYNPDGTLDTSFGGSGKTFGQIQGNTTQAYSVSLQADNRIVIAGSTGEGTDEDFALTRFDPDASLDPTFGTAGKVITDFGNGGDASLSVVIQTDGKILTGGYAEGASGRDLALARYLSGLNIGIVEFSEQSAALLIYPNPIRNSARLEFELSKAEDIDILLYDMRGELVQTMELNIHLPKGQHTLALTFKSSLAAGNYLLAISNGNGTQEVMVLKE